MGRHRYVLGRGIKLFHQALGRDAMLLAHPLPADGPTLLRWQRMGRHRYVLGRAMEPFHQALGRDAMLSAHPLLADGPTSLRPRPRHQAFPPGSRPRRNVVGPFVASGWADIATS